jgi:type 1 glutamine amidotransferase
MTQANGGLNRRDVLKAAGVMAAGAFASQFPLGTARGAEGKTRKILFFTKSSGFQHDVVKRPKNNPNELAYAEKFMVEFGKKHNFEVTPTKDGSVFTEQGLEPYDVIMFYTTLNLTDPGTDGTPPMPKDGKETLIKFIGSGKGFLGLHCAADTFHSTAGHVDPYIEMLGGEFVTHGAQQDSKIIATDKDWAPSKGLEDFTTKEEWYQLKNFAPDLHVILVQDTQSMQEEGYRKLKPYPETWARMHEKGRVFYSSMGHREDVWESDIFQKVLLGGLQWAAGDVEADVKPNLKEAAPGALDRVRGASPA